MAWYLLFFYSVLFLCLLPVLFISFVPFFSYMSSPLVDFQFALFYKSWEWRQCGADFYRQGWQCEH